MSQEIAVVLWDEKEAKASVKKFVKDYADFRQSLYDHYKHKGHVALKYDDSMAGFLAYAHEQLKLELADQTIRLQISTAQVTERVGVNVPMVISRHLAKLPPEKQQEVYEEVIGAREKAGQRSANEMEPDIRRVVRREMGVIEPADPVDSPTSQDEEDDTMSSGVITGYVEDMAAQEPRTEDLADQEGDHSSDDDDAYTAAYRAARVVLQDWCKAFDAADSDAQLSARMNARSVLAEFADLD